MRMLCLAAESDPIGYVKIADRPCTAQDLAKLTSESNETVDRLLAELETNGVFSRTRGNVIYSRRMVRDSKKAVTARQNGQMGGHPQVLRGTVPKADRSPRKTISQAQRHRIFLASNGRCHWCSCELIDRHSGRGDVPLNLMHVDHVIPIRDGGTNDASNLVAACRVCNGLRAVSPSADKQTVPRPSVTHGVTVGPGISQKPEASNQKKVASVVSEVTRSLTKPPGNGSGANYDDPAVRKQRWVQKVSNHLLRVMSADRAEQIITGYQRGEKWAKDEFEKADSAMRGS